MNKAPVYCLYLLYCDQDFLYTGIAIDPEVRLKQHRSKKPPGAKFTRRFKQLELVYQVSVGSRARAQNLEYHIKRLSKKDKHWLVKQKLSMADLQQFLGLND